MTERINSLADLGVCQEACISDTMIFEETKRCPPSILCSPSSTVRSPSSGFTLLELLVVMVVMVIILTISLPAFINIGRGASLRTAANNVYATLALTRQWAITHREQITFVGSATGLTYNVTNGVISLATNDHACYYVTNPDGNVIQAVTDLPLDITFKLGSASDTNLAFDTDGGLAAGNNPQYFVLRDKRNPSVTMTITVNGFTGGIKVE